MIGFKLTITAPGGSAVDYSSYCEKVKIQWPATTNVPTCTVILNNSSGIFASVPLWGTMAITLPNSVGTFTFWYEVGGFEFSTGAGGGQSIGHHLEITGTSAPELLLLSEGNLDVCGTDLQVYQFTNRPGSGSPSLYVPYVSTYVSALNSDLMDVGNVLTALLHTSQPNQLPLWKGRLGYDATGMGIRLNGYIDPLVWPGLLMYIPFEEGSGSHANDYGGFGANMTLFGTYSWVTGKYGTAVQGDGATAYGTIPDATQHFPMKADFTWSFWFKLAATAAQQRLLQKYTGGAGVSVYNTAGGNFKVDCGASTISGAAADTSIHHCIVERASGTVTFYLDGVSQGTAAVAGDQSAASDLFALAASAAPLQPANAWIDEFRFYPRALSSTERSTLLTSSPYNIGGCDYVDGAQSLYVKGQWKVGAGNTGAQQYGIDLIKNILTKNLIDTTGTPQYLDWYVDPTTTPPKLKVNLRGSNNSAVSFAVGTDPLQYIKLPVDIKNVRNFVIAWSNNESIYPGGGDDWSNYDTGPHLLAQWPDTVTAGSGTHTVDSTTTAFGYGTSIKYVNGANSTWKLSSLFDLPTNGYAVLAPARGITSLSFYFRRQFAENGAGQDQLTVYLADESGNSVTMTVGGAGSPTFPGATTWKQLVFPIPASGRGSWLLNSGTWDFSVNSIAQVIILPWVGYDGANRNTFWFDYIQFADNWNFSPTYTYNLQGPSNTQVNSVAAAGNTVLALNSVAAFVVGQYIVINPGGTNQELVQISSITTGVYPPGVVLPSPGLLFAHSIGEAVVGATHDLNSVAAYGPRVFNFVDFYVNNGSSDGMEAIAFNILNSRKGKSSQGTVTVSGYAVDGSGNSKISPIKPGYRFALTDVKDVYTGGTVDSTIAGWIADVIEYVLEPMSSQGFTVTFTVEPYYSSIAPGSPDLMFKNLWNAANKTPADLIAKLYRMSQDVSPQR